MAARIDALNEFIWQLRRAFWDLAAAADDELKGLGIRAGDRALLEWLAREPGPQSLSEIARKAGVSRQHVHQALRRLPEPAWITLSHDPQDARAVTLTLSRAGCRFWERVREADARFLARYAPRLDAGEVAAATALLLRLRQSLQHNRKESDHV
jgi:DNA-binding MarR family transcriptional regulator